MKVSSSCIFNKVMRKETSPGAGREKNNFKRIKAVCDAMAEEAAKINCLAVSRRMKASNMMGYSSATNNASARAYIIARRKEQKALANAALAPTPIAQAKASKGRPKKAQITAEDIIAAAQEINSMKVSQEVKNLLVKALFDAYKK